MLTQDRTVDDIYKLFAFIEKGYSELYYFTQLEAKLTAEEDFSDIEATAEFLNTEAEDAELPDWLK